MKKTMYKTVLMVTQSLNMLTETIKTVRNIGSIFIGLPLERECIIAMYLVFLTFVTKYYVF